MVAATPLAPDPAEVFLAHLEQLGTARNTLLGYRTMFSVVREQLGPVDLLAATPADLQRVFVMSDWARSVGAPHRTLMGRRLAGFYRWAVEDAGLLVEVPTAMLERHLGKQKSPRRELPKFLSLEELDLLLAAMAGNLNAARDQAITRVMANAGGRLEETLRLQLTDLDLPRIEAVRFRHVKYGKQRYVPVVPELREALRAYLRVRGTDVEVTPAVFLSAWGTAYRANRAWPLLLREAAERAAIQWVVCRQHGERACQMGEGGCPNARWRVHPHTLRHTFAVEALRSGACNIAELRDLMGHSSISVTNIYTMVVGDEASAAKFVRRFGKRR